MFQCKKPLKMHWFEVHSDINWRDCAFANVDHAVKVITVVHASVRSKSPGQITNTKKHCVHGKVWSSDVAVQQLVCSTTEWAKNCNYRDWLSVQPSTVWSPFCMHARVHKTPSKWLLAIFCFSKVSEINKTPPFDNIRSFSVANFSFDTGKNKMKKKKSRLQISQSFHLITIVCSALLELISMDNFLYR